MTIEQEIQRITELWHNIEPKIKGDLANLWEERHELGELEARIEALEPKVIKLLEVIQTLKRHSAEYRARTDDLIKLLHHFSKYETKEWIQKVTADLEYLSGEITNAVKEGTKVLQSGGFESLEKIMSQVYEGIRNNIFDSSKNSINLGYMARAINENQRGFLMDLVTKAESSGLDNAIERLGSVKEGAAYYFEDITQLNLVASAFLRILFEKHPPNNEVKSYIQNSHSKLTEIQRQIENIHNSVPDERKQSGCLRVLDKIRYVIGELEAYESFYGGRAFQLYSLVTPPKRSEYQTRMSAKEQIEYNNWSIRNETRKILSPMSYFSEKEQRLVTEDITLVTDLYYKIGNVRELVKQLIITSGLEDISPEVGDRFNSHLQTLIYYREGYPRERIAEVLHRGFRYKGKIIIKASVLIGR